MRSTCFLVVCFVTAALILLPGLGVAAESGELKYTPQQILETPPETFLDRMQTPEPGYHRFAAMWALSQKIKDADAEAKRSMLIMVITAMMDKSRTENQRFQCCYVISGSGEEWGVPDLIMVLLKDESEVMRSVAVEALANFPNNQAARGALLQAARTETSQRVRETLERRLGKDAAKEIVGPSPTPTQPIQAGDQKYTSEQIKNTPAETFLERMQNPEPGYHRFSAMWALTQKLKDATGNTHRMLRNMVIAAMKDKSRTENQRFQCCYVISGSGDEWGIPDLIRVLFDDPSEVMRAVAVEALADFPNNTTAHNALLRAACTETSQRVREVLARRLGKEMPAQKD